MGKLMVGMGKSGGEEIKYGFGGAVGKWGAF